MIIDLHIIPKFIEKKKNRSVYIDDISTKHLVDCIVIQCNLFVIENLNV